MNSGEALLKEIKKLDVLRREFKDLFESLQTSVNDAKNKYQELDNKIDDLWEIYHDHVLTGEDVLILKAKKQEQIKKEQSLPHIVPTSYTWSFK